MKLDKEHNPGGAVWCEEHKTLECKGIKKRSRERCHSTAIRGTANCNIHAGQTTEKAIAMGEARISAWQALGAPPVGGSVDPGQAVMAVLDMTWQRTAIYGDLLRKQFEKGRQQAEQATGLSGDQLADSGGATSGLIGQKMSAAPGTGEIYATGEEIRGSYLLPVRAKTPPGTCLKQRHAPGGVRTEGVSRGGRSGLSTRIDATCRSPGGRIRPPSRRARTPATAPA